MLIALLLRGLAGSPLLMLLIAGFFTLLPLGLTQWCVVSVLLSALALVKTRGALQRHAAVALVACLGLLAAALAGLTGTPDGGNIVALPVAAGLQLIASIVALARPPREAPLVVGGRVCLALLGLILLPVSLMGPALHDAGLPEVVDGLAFMGLLFVAAPVLSRLLTRILSQRWVVDPVALSLPLGDPLRSAGLLIFTPPAALPAEVRIEHFRHPALVRITVSLPELPGSLSIQRRVGEGGQAMRDPLLSSLLRVEGAPAGLLDGLHAELLSVLHSGHGVLERGRIELTFGAELAEEGSPAAFIAARLQEALELGVALQAAHRPRAPSADHHATSAGAIDA